MDEYIKKEAVLDLFGEVPAYTGYETYPVGVHTLICEIAPLIKDEIRKIPAADVAPVRHGRWVIEKRHAVSRNPYIDDNYFASATCSECDFCIHAETKSFGYPDLNTTNYCPNCGAKMDGDSHEA